MIIDLIKGANKIISTIAYLSLMNIVLNLLLMLIFHWLEYTKIKRLK